SLHDALPLHPQIKVLYTHAHAIESQIAQMLHGTGGNASRMDFDGKLAAFIINEIKVLAGSVHQQAHFIAVDKGRRATTPMQLFYRTPAIKPLCRHRNSPHDAVQIGFSATLVIGHDFIASTVETQGVTEGNMKVQ